MGVRCLWNMKMPGFFCVYGCGRGTPEEGGIAPGVEAVGDVFGVLRGGCIEERQRKVASLQAGTPSGDTTRAP